MAAVTVCSNFGDQENKIHHCFHFSPIYFPRSDGTRCHELSLVFFFLMLSFKNLLSSFAAFHSLLSPSSRGSLVPLHGLPLEWYHLPIWGCWFQLVIHPVQDFAWFTLHINLNKHSENLQPWCTPFPILNQSVFLCLILTVVSWPAFRFLRREVRWSGTPIFSRIFHSLLWSTPSKTLV